MMIQLQRPVSFAHGGGANGLGSPPRGGAAAAHRLIVHRRPCRHVHPFVGGRPRSTVRDMVTQR